MKQEDASITEEPLYLITNSNEIISRGQKLADGLAKIMGSWHFIIIQSIILAIWILINSTNNKPYDPYPFILLNLMLSFQAAYAAPVIMMSQNRQAAKDRAMAEEDYVINIKAEEENREIMDHLEKQDEKMIAMLKRAEEQHIMIMERLNRHPGFILD